MGREEMANHRSDTLTFLLTLYEAGLAVYAMYYVAVTINHLIPESLLPNPLSLNLLFP
jgi:hypothetical protein